MNPVNDFDMARKSFLIFMAVVLWQFSTTAQIPRTLQIAITNGTITVSSQNSPGYFIGQLETTTNLSPPVVCEAKRLTYVVAGESDSFAATNAARFFRLVQFYPLFQFAIFYNVNMEIAPVGTMVISGPVFCNANIWEGSSVCTFASTITAVGTNAVGITDPFCPGKTGSGTPTFTLAGQPVSGNAPLFLPIGTNMNPANARTILDLPPAAYAMGTAAAYSTNGLVYLANAADLVISNAATGTNSGTLTPRGTNLLVYFQDSGLTPVQYDYFIITNGNLHKTFPTNYISPTLLGLKTNIYFAGYSWITNAIFYDWREGWNGGFGPPKKVEAVQIDISLLNKWLTNTSSGVVNSGYAIDATKVGHSGHHIDSVYVYNSVPLSGTPLPAVRVVNGAQLPNPGGSTAGFTVATPFPMYVKGNYNSQDSTGSALGTNNTTHTYPAALMADSITVLSAN